MADETHPIRKMTRQVAFEPRGWTPERASKVADLFNGLAPEWGERVSLHRSEPLEDALERGDVAAGLCVEVGSGTGIGKASLAKRFPRVVAVDLAIEMLRRAPSEDAARVQADAARLPVASLAAASIVLFNALLFPSELERVLAAGGTIVWVNTLGDRTPIHLPVRDVERALPGEWSGVASEAAWGIWAVLRRSGT